MRRVMGTRVAVAAAIALITGIFIVTQVSAQLPTIKISSATISAGGSGSVELQSLDIGAPGLGAWEIGVTYDFPGA